MKTQPQRLLEEIIPLPEWVHEEWHKEITQKWDIIHAGGEIADALRGMIALADDLYLSGSGRVVIARAKLEAWDKLLNVTKPTDV